MLFCCLLACFHTGTLQSIHNEEKNKTKQKQRSQIAQYLLMARRSASAKDFLFLSIDIDMMSLLAGTKQLSNNVTNRHFKVNETTHLLLYCMIKTDMPGLACACVFFLWAGKNFVVAALASGCQHQRRNPCRKAGRQSRDGASANGALTGSRAAKPRELSATWVSRWALSSPAVTGRVRIAGRKES